MDDRSPRPTATYCHEHRVEHPLTWDRGLEMALHEDFSIATDVKVYFCDPRSPWQRGTNENTNRLLRQYLPKQSDLAEHSQAELNKIALQLNQRPRKTLGFRCPADKLDDLLRRPIELAPVTGR